jgi:4-amino-4-deoxy-L-arabinose transferase-like glycosyltransferase
MIAPRLQSPWVAALALLLAVWGFWSLPLYDLDEGAFTEATREMLASGNFSSIYLDGEPRQDKPILIYWLQAASVSLFGLDEFALRLPSVLAALAWALAIYRFGAPRLGRDSALVATMLMALSLYVGLIAKAAVADALLNLFMALSFFGIYRFWEQGGRRDLYLTYLWLGLGFLTKGPVAVVFPLLVSGLFFTLQGDWRRWLRAVFAPGGWLLFLAIVLPWHVMVYLDSGWAFFQGFYLGHNLGRFSGAMEGHGGGWWYYLAWAPLVVMPFAGWLIATLPRLRQIRLEPLDQYLWLWFVIVLVFFSFSGTKLPHYLLYGCTPLFLLMAQYREGLRSRWLAFAPALVLLALLAAAPQLFDYLAAHTRRLYDQQLFKDGMVAFDTTYQVIAGAALAVALAIALWRRLRPWQGLLLVGFIQALLVGTQVLPRVFAVLQGPVKQVAEVSRDSGHPLVPYRIYQPSISVYRQAITERRAPHPGDWVLVRIDHLDEFMRRDDGLRKTIVFQRGTIALVSVEAAS